MTSIKAKIFTCLMRNRHLFEGKLKKGTFKQDVGSVLAFRAKCEKGAQRFGKLPKNITTKQEVINMVLSEWLIPENAPKDKLIFYVHGGGYVSGSCNDHRAIISKIADRSGIVTLLYEYGLAPENPFPAALDDSLNVYRAVLDKGYKPENIVMMGESAGGGLCLAILLALKDKSIPLPKAAVVISPWTDLSCSSGSYTTKNKVSVAPTNCWNVFSHYYVANNDVKNPYISPLFGNLNGLPPIYINAGESDELFEDGKKFYEKAVAAGADVTFRDEKGMIHCYPLLAPMFREASEAMQEIIGFIKMHFEE